LAHLGLQITRYKNVVSVVLRWVGSTKANAVPSSNMGAMKSLNPEEAGISRVERCRRSLPGILSFSVLCFNIET
jgi:hypothetical protein